MAFTLPPLPYDYNALEPHIDEQTMRIHHDKHHATYVNNLNAALESHPDLQKKSIEQLLAKHRRRCPRRSARRSATTAAGTRITRCSGRSWRPAAPRSHRARLRTPSARHSAASTQFKEQFAKACAGRFGSGWGWLTADKSGALAIESTPNQDTPLMSGKTPILGCDVWEHAYYLKYQNRRPDYVTAWWNVVNWTEVGQRFAAAQSLATASSHGLASRGRLARARFHACRPRPAPMSRSRAAREERAARVLPSCLHRDLHQGDGRVHGVTTSSSER